MSTLYFHLLLKINQLHYFRVNRFARNALNRGCDKNTSARQKETPLAEQQKIVLALVDALECAASYSAANKSP